ncbi:MAG: pirin family protein [Burkholderiales bacterium]|nr:pirin family protein [Burkholderiales bacterium]
MNATTLLPLLHTRAHHDDSRRVALQTSGHTHGPITRLVSPGDLGEQIKPFIFLDHCRIRPGWGGMGMHPHSGIATLTWAIRGSIRYEDSTGQSGVLPAGGVEWMRAGGGVWHGGGVAGHAPFEGFQLWVALPPTLENGPAESLYLAPDCIPTIGPAKLLLGSYGGAVSAIPPVAPMNYLGVTLEDGESWEYQPPPGHDVAWIAVNRGELQVSDAIGPGWLAIFEEGEAPIRCKAVGRTEFVLGSALKHPHELVLGSYSVHTNSDALRKGEASIRRIGLALADAGKLKLR